MKAGWPHSRGQEERAAAERLATPADVRLVAHPEVFSSENINRQNGCDVTTLGINKAEVIADIIRRINPDADVTVEISGITLDNVDGTSVARIWSSTKLSSLNELAAMLARASSARSIPVLMRVNIGFGSLVTSFMPTGITVERYLGLPETASLEEVAALNVYVTRRAPRLPAYLCPRNRRAS